MILKSHYSPVTALVFALAVLGISSNTFAAVPPPGGHIFAYPDSIICSDHPEIVWGAFSFGWMAPLGLGGPELDGDRMDSRVLPAPGSAGGYEKVPRVTNLRYFRFFYGDADEGEWEDWVYWDYPEPNGTWTKQGEGTYYDPTGPNPPLL